MPNFGTRKRKVYHMCTTKWGEKTSISTHFSRLWYSFGTQIAICGTPFSGCTTSETIIFYNFNHFYNIYSFSKKDILLYISGFIADILVLLSDKSWQTQEDTARLSFSRWSSLFFRFPSPPQPKSESSGEVSDALPRRIIGLLESVHPFWRLTATSVH